MKKVNSRMVAKAAGVSQATVSRVLREDPHVSADTRACVLEHARRLGYDLCGRDARRVALLLPPPERPLSSFWNAVLVGVCGNFAARGWHVELFFADHLESLDERLLDGAVDFSSSETLADIWSSRFHIPLVRTQNGSRRQNNISAALLDCASMMFRVVSLFRDYGHREIFYLTTTSEAEERANPTRRLAGFYHACDSCKIPHPERHCVFLPPDASDASLEHAIERILRDGATALYCAEETLALRLDTILDRMGLQIPKDLSRIDPEVPNVSAFLRPPRTTVQPDETAAVLRIANLLAQMLATGKAPPNVLLPIKLVVRNSVAAPPQNV
ncbi:MAG: LacI family DNA-binding transcriptional regulator [Victivallales bacterium]|nr:LacI family DNA-binding transcriptional regulator [Victivallales bacterium]